MSKYSVILPTYNERENLPIITYLIFEMAKKNNLDFEIVIIEDNSPDGTLQVAQELKKVYGDKLIIHFREKKLGLGSAYMDGIKLCHGNFVVIMDADLSHHPKYLKDFIEKQKETNCDIVTGSRYINKGGVMNWGFDRKLTSRGANFLASTMLGVKCSDLTGSFRLYKREVLEKVIKDVVSRGYAFQMEIIIRARKYGFTVEEVPIVFVERIFGESKLGASEFQIYLKGLWKLLWTF
ncbi:unnamed protein product [Paramecium sonneborni]|uniref:Dolichol-phosphate mannosyltransferase subunit 1 n=1 Tax=Paramecium sonneborni TaxID=65129 RepID=A0A8S1P568_9CILI|nr:unnamed protein product [Paramecium sonneborni]